MMSHQLSSQTQLMIPGKAGVLETILSNPTSTSGNLSSRPKAISIICHPHPLYGGTLQNKVITTLHNACQKHDLYTVRFNYRGVGKSQGSFGQAVGETDDLLSVLNWVREHYPNTPIILAGFSFGCYITLSATLKMTDKPLMLIHVAPPVNHYDFITPSHSISYPWLVIHGDNDELVPIDVVKTWADHQMNVTELITIKDCTHFFHGKLIDLQTIVEQHLQDLWLSSNNTKTH